MDRWTHRIRNNPGRSTDSNNPKDKTQTRSRHQKQRTDCGRNGHAAGPSRDANLHRDVRRYGHSSIERTTTESCSTAEVATARPRTFTSGVPATTTKTTTTTE